MKVLWTEGAADDLAAIADYIAADSPQAARRVAAHIFGSTTALGNAPYIGRKRPDDTAREFVFAPWPYIALYEVTDNSVVIKAVRHTARDWSD
jgi:toxin ParE1/3/4